MYALICMGVLYIAWGVILYREFRYVHQENEVRKNNQAYYKQKIEKIKSKINEQNNETKT